MCQFYHRLRFEIASIIVVVVLNFFAVTSYFLKQTKSLGWLVAVKGFTKLTIPSDCVAWWWVGMVVSWWVGLRNCGCVALGETIVLGELLRCLPCLDTQCLETQCLETSVLGNFVRFKV